MIVGRKLLFHHPNVDDSVGTYVTDYVLAAVCYFVATGITILKHQLTEPLPEKKKCSRLLPWHWPGKTVVVSSLSTYATLVFLISYGSVALFGGLPHQFLQEVNSTSPHDEFRWLVSWRIAAGLSIVAFCAFLTLCEQLYQQEKFLALPSLARKIFYVVLCLFGVAALIANFTRITYGEEGFNIDRLFVIFMAGIMIYAFSLLILMLRGIFVYLRNRPELTFRWDLVLHCGCPWLILSGGIFSFILTPSCSHDNAYIDYGCPLPDYFNHNAVMHLIHALAAICMGIGEVVAMKRRKKTWEDESEFKNAEPLV